MGYTLIFDHIEYADVVTCTCVGITHTRLEYLYMVGTLMWMGVSAIALIVFSWKSLNLSRAFNKRVLKAPVFNRAFDRAIEDNLLKLTDIIHKMSSFDFDEFSRGLNTFNEGIGFYKFYDKAFYNDLLVLTRNIEDEIVEIENTKDLAVRASGLLKVEVHLRSIFDTINRYCSDLYRKQTK